MRQVLSKYEHFAEFRPTLGEGRRENPRLWPRAKVAAAAAASLRRLAKRKRKRMCVRARRIYIYAKKTIKFSHIGKDCASFRATNAKFGVIYITTARALYYRCAVRKAGKEPSFFIAEFLSRRARKRVV